MVDLEVVRDLVAYNRAVFGRFQRSIQRRPWKAVTADRGTGHLSLKDTLVHILNVHEAWLVAVAQGQWEVFDEPGRRASEIGSWSAFRTYERKVWVGVDRLLTSLSASDLRRRVRAPWMPGRYTLGDAFFQTTIEQAHHLGEVIAVYWQNDWRPPEMTWIPTLRGR
ncbi:MAG TPA: DinB family protein [Thermoplasmata archaeon]|nr:DinB family protein [Thermoplasmata archaeon]